MASLFIGLGGVGTGVLDYLNEKMNNYNTDLRRQRRPEVQAHYYYIDTENARFAQHPQEFMGSTYKTFKQIGAKSPDAIRNGLMNGATTNNDLRRQYELLQKWCDAPHKTTNMIAGADTIRQYSRLAFEEDINYIRNDLYTLIQGVTATQGRIYVITGSCGGTGCGIYMDLLYMISEIYEDQQTPAASTDVRLIMAMPEGYVADGNIDVQFHKKKLNAFATLEELNAICKDKQSAPPLFNGCFPGSNVKAGVFQPFRFGYMFDSAGIKRDEVSQKLSDFLFELELAGDPSNGLAIGAGYNGSFFDGLLTGTVDGNWNASITNDYVKAFNALGQYSIEKPDFLYREYFNSRLLYDVFHEGLIGKVENVDQNVVSNLASILREICDLEIGNSHEFILNNYVSKANFANDRQANMTFTVFSKSPNMLDSTVKNIMAQKTVLLQTIRDKVYQQCKEWLEQYDFSTVYAVMESLDREKYSAATTTHESFDEQLAKAKSNSMRGGLFSKKGIDAQKALDEFGPLLNTWLAFEVNKALSSGVGVDITVKNQGYLDLCKSFIESAKLNVVLDREQEHWDNVFVKKVTDLKVKDDRSYIPSLDTIVDDRNQIIPAPDSRMVSVYEYNVKVGQEIANLMQGTCTPVMLHAVIIDAMKANPSLRQEGIDMDMLFDPTPEKTNSLRDVKKASLFVEKYVAAAKQQIHILLQANQNYQNLFAGTIVQRLQTLPAIPKAQMCLKFVGYDEVQLKTIDMAGANVTSYTYYVVDYPGPTQEMIDLGIVNAQGDKSDNTDHTPANPFFDDKIVKLIVKNGYKIDDYRYFAEYARYAAENMRDGQTHDPFIDKRFLGDLDKDGKYPCNVSAALTKISTDAHAAMQADEYSLDGFDDVEVYKFGLALLYEYFETLKTKGSQIDKDLENAITRVPGTHSINIQQPTYNNLRRKYTLGSMKTVDLDSLKSINNMEDLTTWIDYIRSKKKCIENEAELYGKAVDDFGLTLASKLEAKIGDMMGQGNKPVYDFFTAYLDWYNKD